jgi:uncharacterized paraquat-inducible protein A
MYCQNCGAKVSTSEKFCHRCGHALAKAQKEHVTTKPETPARTAGNARRLIMWGWILVAMIPLAILGFAVVQFVVNAAGIEPGGIFQVTANTLVFLVGALGVPGLPVGIILLVLGYSRRRKAPHGA